eukprot:TRINITY_DN10434_c0_g1_i1.p4 TRINITY_DN10434_c0_g1~~TRINITY_DN10434_c0_g1_i1.p4  ORF type:complete len:100 (+),score=2.61 TRINITY_DN10434_c0_g1_i1:371-670(+)
MELVVSDVCVPVSTYQQVVLAFPKNKRRYGVLDWEYINKDDEIFWQLISVHWCGYQFVLQYYQIQTLCILKLCNQLLCQFFMVQFQLKSVLQNQIKIGF